MWLVILDMQYDYEIDYTSDAFLTTAMEQYRKFLHLTAKYPQDYDTPGPTHPIDLFWHTHQMHPSAYESDCIQLMGQLLDHVLLLIVFVDLCFLQDPWPHERFTEHEFTSLLNAYGKLWQREFHEVEWIYA